MDAKFTVTDMLLNNLDICNATAEVYPGDRFIEAGIPFKIRVMTNDEFQRWSKDSTSVKISKGKRETDFNSKMFNELCIINCTVDPNFKDAKMLEKAGCQTPEQFLNRVLKPGEAAFLSAEISALAGFDKELDEMKDEVKN